MRTVFTLTLDVNGKQKTEKRTFLTLAKDTEEAVFKVRRYCSEKQLQAVIKTCAPKPALTFVEDAEDK